MSTDIGQLQVSLDQDHHFPKPVIARALAWLRLLFLIVGIILGLTVPILLSQQISYSIALARETLPKMLIIDNYDSFTYNLVQLFGVFQLSVIVRRSDLLSVEEAKAIDPQYLVISPGPGRPSHAGNSIALIRAFYCFIPVLGICLGMQCINEVFGGITVPAPEPVHGKTSLIRHTNRFLFDSLPSPLRVARYHSLMSNQISPELAVTAYGPDKVVMGLSHEKYPLHGVQFHPESFLTEFGMIMALSFLKLGPSRF